MLGKRLGPYEIIEELGSGGMATVYRAYHPAMDRFVAVKVLKENLALDKPTLEQFKHEARLIARLEHPHLLPIYDYSADSKPAYIVMRYIEGTSLRTILDRSGALPFHEVVHICRQIASVLDYAHSQGVIHRDIKAENILVDTVGNAYLTDFGIAGFIGDRKSALKNSIVGTPAYMSPEQIAGKERLSPSTDIYSLGVLLFELATGRLPFEAATEDDMMKKHLYAPIPSAKTLNPDLPDRIEIFFQKALAKNPAERMASVLDMRRALESMMQPNEAFRSLLMVKEVAKAEVQEMQESRGKAQNPVIIRKADASHGSSSSNAMETFNRLQAPINDSGEATQIRKRGAGLYYLIIILFFVISVLLFIGIMGFPKSESVQMTQIAQTRAVLAMAQTATVASGGILPSPNSPSQIIPSPSPEAQVVVSPSSAPVMSPIPNTEVAINPSPIPQEIVGSSNLGSQGTISASPTTQAIISTDPSTDAAMTVAPPNVSESEPIGYAFMNLPSAEAIVLFPQAAIYSLDKAFEVELNPANVASESARLFAATGSSLVVTGVDAAGIHLSAAQDSFLVTDSGGYTYGIEFAFQNHPDIFFYLEAGESCVGVDAISANVLYFDCLVGACSYRLGSDTTKHVVPAGQRMVAGFPEDTTERLSAIPDSAILHYQGFLQETGAGANHLDCVENYQVSRNS